MARPEITGRKTSTRVSKRKRKQQRIYKNPTSGKTIEQWCDSYGWSRATWNRAQDAGTGPAIIQPSGPGGRVIVTPESEAEWIRRHTRRPETKAVAPPPRNQPQV
jgi:hypothetical protein